MNRSGELGAIRSQDWGLLPFRWAAVLVLLTSLVSGIHLKIESQLLGFTTDPWTVTALFVLVGFVSLQLLSLPISYFTGFLAERRAGLSTLSLSSWIRDRIKIIVVGLPVALAGVEMLYFSLRAYTTFWWFLAWLFFSGLTIFLIYVEPVAIAPLFYKFPRLENPTLQSKLTELAGRAGVNVVGVHEMKASSKTKKAYGALAGIGNTRRIIISDTLLNNFTEDEIEGVIGHELGHHVHHDFLRGILFYSIVSLFILYMTSVGVNFLAPYFGITDISFVSSAPLLALMLTLLTVGFMPVFNSYSRWVEAQADQYELELVGKPQAFATTITRLCDQNLRWADPTRVLEVVFYDHPSGRR